MGAGFGGRGELREAGFQARLWGGGDEYLSQTANEPPVRVGDLWQALQRLLGQYGPAAGFLTYEFARAIAPEMTVHRDGSPLPAVYWVWPQWSEARPMSNVGSFRAQGAMACSLSEAAFRRGVETIRSAIGAGSVYQVNLTRRWEVGFAGDPAGLFLELCGKNPPRFAFFLEDEALGFAVCGLSPELFLSRRGQTVESWPIKGTWPVGGAPARVGEKEAAELAMIVDLVRHDLGRVCEVGSVEVVDPSRPLRTRDVVHREAVVRGELRPEVNLRRLLAATFPGGSVTGAPKIAACRMIAELEPVPRSVYCGAYGVIEPNGDLALAMPIRTGYVVGGRLYVHAGAGIVWDSDPEAEERETRAKVRSWFAALGVRP